MARSGQKPRRVRIALLALLISCFAVAAAAPFFFNIVDRELELEPAGLVAAGRDTFTIAAPLVLDRRLGTTISGGQLALQPPKGRKLSGHQARRLIDQGVADLVVHRADISIGDLSTVAAYVTDRPQVAIAAALEGGRFATLRVVGGSLAVSLPGGSIERLTRVDAQFIRVGRHALKGAGKGLWRGQKISFTLKTGAVGAGDTHDLPFEFKVRGGLVAIDFAGRVGRDNGLRLSGSAEVASVDVRRLARALGAAWPDGLGLRDLSVSGPLNWSGHTLSFAKALVRLDGNSGAGALSINTAGAKALATGTIAFEKFDFAPYLPGTPAARAGLPTHDGGWLSRLRGAWSMPAATLFDADLRVSMRDIRLGDQRIGRAASSLSLKNGALLANVAELAFEGGSGSGALEIDFNGLAPRVTLRGRLVNVPFGSLGATLFGVRGIDGRGTLTADLVANGATVRQMLTAVSGTLDVDMPKGGRLGLDLRAFDVHLKGVRQAGVPLSQSFARAQKGATTISSLRASILLTGGRLSTRSFKAHYAGRAAHLTGRADFSSRLVDMRLLIVEQPAVDSTAAKPVIPDGRPLVGSLTRVTGDWRTPHVAASSHLARWSELERLLSPSAGPLSGRRF